MRAVEGAEDYLAVAKEASDFRLKRGNWWQGEPPADFSQTAQASLVELHKAMATRLETLPLASCVIIRQPCRHKGLRML